MECKYCGKTYSVWDEVAGDCPHCWHKFNQWVANGMTPGWNKVLGNTEDDKSTIPQFSEWRKGERIKKQLEDGKITPEEAKRQASELMERVRKFYNPTPEEMKERQRRYMANQARIAAENDKYRDISPLFD